MIAIAAINASMSLILLCPGIIQIERGRLCCALEAGCELAFSSRCALAARI
jgi:hypothetical protein